VASPFPICYLNGEYLPLSEARISPLDRGFLFADSIYEVVSVHGGRPYRFREHCERLERSLQEIRLVAPHSRDEWLQIVSGTAERNEAHNCYVYLQVTRGMEFGRNHAFPAEVRPTVFALCSPLPELTAVNRRDGLSAITVDEFRWGRCDIKSTMLLANVLMKQRASEAEANEAIIVDGDRVLEGASTSVFVVRGGVIATPPNGSSILPGTTRNAVLDLAKDKLPPQVRDIRRDELFSADEVWISAATRAVLPITRIDGKTIGDGRPGPLWQRMLGLFEEDRARLRHTPAL